jgi:hypothetical protein
VGQLQHLAAWGKAVMPGVYGQLATPTMKFVGFTDEQSGQHDGNVFEPQPDLDAPTGGWRHPLARTVSLALAAPAAVGASWAVWRHRSRTR